MVGFAVLPWNAIGGQGFLGFRWLRRIRWAYARRPPSCSWSVHGRLWLLPLAVALALPVALAVRARIGNRACIAAA